jgi:hypothetical protein
VGQASNIKSFDLRQSNFEEHDRTNVEKMMNLEKLEITSQGELLANPRYQKFPFIYEIQIE